MKTGGQPLLRAGLILLGLVLLALAWGAKQLPRGSGDRLELSPGVVGIRAGGSYAWILHSAKGAALVDTGLEPDGAAVIAELKAQGLRPTDVHSILLTHGHKDHWAAAVMFPNAKVYLGSPDIDWVQGRKKGGAVHQLLDRTLPRAPIPPHLEAVQDGALLELDGLKVRVVALPGHTAGSMAYLLGDTLFVGDAVLGRGSDAVTPPPAMLSEDPEENLRSLQTLIAPDAASRGIRFTRFADGHTGIVQDAKQKLQRMLR